MGIPPFYFFEINHPVLLGKYIQVQESIGFHYYRKSRSEARREILVLLEKESSHHA